MQDFYGFLQSVKRARMIEGKRARFNSVTKHSPSLATQTTFLTTSETDKGLTNSEGLS